MIEGTDYCFIYPKAEKDVANIKLLTGPYTGTVYRYGKVKFKEDAGQMHLIFAYDVLESTIDKPKKLMKDSAFKQYVGDLLVEIMTSNMDEEIIDETGNDDSSESGDE